MMRASGFQGNNLVVHMQALICCHDVAASLPVYSGMMLGLAESINSPSHWTKAKVCVIGFSLKFLLPFYLSPDPSQPHDQGTSCAAKYM